MTNQPSLYETPIPMRGYSLPSNETATSNLARDKAKMSSQSDRSRILALLRKNKDGLTRSQIAKLSNIPVNTVNGRVSELLGANGRLPVMVEVKGRRKNERGSLEGVVVAL